MEKEPTWSEVRIQVADYDKYWHREARHPATRFIADGKKAPIRGPDEEDVPFNNKRSAGVALIEHDPSPPAGDSKRAKKQVANLRSELERLKTQLAVTRMGLGRGSGSSGSGSGGGGGDRGNSGDKGAGKS